jgi:signal transduction histidine kinase/CheY-like chemotaxis protein
MNLRLKFVLFVIAPLFLVFAAILAVGLQAFEDNTRKTVAGELAQSAELHAARIEVLLHEVAQIANTTAAHLGINSDIDEATAFDILRSNVESSPLVFGAALAFEPDTFSGRRLFGPYVYRRGKDLAEIVSTELDYDYTRPEWDWWNLPREALANIWTEPYFDEGGGNIYMTTFSAPFFREGRFVGVATIDIPLEPLKQLISSLQSGQGQHFMLLSARHRILYSDNAEHIGLPVKDVFQQLGWPDVEVALEQAAASGNTRMLQLEGWDSANTQWISPAMIESGGWMLLSIQDEARALAFLNSQKARAISILSAVFVAGIVAIWLLLNWVTRPLGNLTRAVEEVGKGNMNIHIERQSGDEIGDLAASFANMARQLASREAALKELNENLEKRVADRTAELTSLQAGLELARDEANAANQAKSEFLANLSHDLRSPMNAILGYSEMLIEDAGELGQKEFIPDLNKINKAGTHLLSLINDVLDLAKIESGKMEAYAEKFSLDSLIDDVSATAHPLMEKNNNRMSIERGKDLGTAWQDLTKLRQTLFNLISNAAKFTHDGAVTLHVNRATQDGQDWLTLAVSDTGIGIAEDKIERVFEEFAQADSSTTRDYGGTGLGLAISRRFCNLLGGDLDVHSEVGEGSTFTIRIPAVLPEVKQPVFVDAASASDAVGAQLLKQVGSASTILVIDDDPEAREIIERFLVKDGFSVVTADSGEQGLRIARECRPAAITLDVMMPGMDGWSFLSVLKADPELRKIPVIMLTMIDDRTRGYSLGAVDYLTKPVDRELLHKALNRYHCAEGACQVLLVDDEAENRELLAHMLEKAGWSVSEAGNGQEALDMMPTISPQLILLDLMMPVMDGFGFLAAMRAHPEWEHIPVIVITAKDLTAEDHSRLAGNVEEVFEKNSCTREQLLKNVRAAVASCSTRKGTSDP